MPSVKLYVTPWCGYCRRAKALLQRKGVPFEEIDLADDPDLRAQLSARTGMRTVPMIFIGDECIGGSDDLHALEASGELDRRLGLSG